MSLIPKKGTVYVVDDDEAVRDSLQWLLEGKDYRVRCFDSAESFLSRYDPREVACLIVDIRMGGMTGLELQNRLIESRSPLPIVFITGHGDVPMAVDTMKKGAMDFIQKPFKEDQLVSLVERMLETARESFSVHQQAASRDALLSKLTLRESQVLERIVAGRLNKQIADDLGISIKTVEAHRANIMEKLNANTVADLLKIALGANSAAAGSAAPRTVSSSSPSASASSAQVACRCGSQRSMCPSTARATSTAFWPGFLVTLSVRAGNTWPAGALTDAAVTPAPMPGVNQTYWCGARAPCSMRATSRRPSAWICSGFSEVVVCSSKAWA